VVVLVLAARGSDGAEGKPKKSFTYTEEWGGECESGKMQSPVNIVRNQLKNASADEHLPDINMDFGVGENFTVVNYGVGMAVEWDQANPSKVLVLDAPNELNASEALLSELADDTYYELQANEWHVHLPSEHTIDGVNYPMEAHLVTSDADGGLHVLGVMYKYDDNDERNELLDVLLSDMSTVRDEVVPLTTNLTFNISDLLPKDEASYSYKGSLTTPPCSEGLTWNVFLTPFSMSVEQATEIQMALNAAGGELTDSRKPQPLNGRPITTLQTVHGF